LRVRPIEEGSVGRKRNQGRKGSGRKIAQRSTPGRRQPPDAAPADQGRARSLREESNQLDKTVSTATPTDLDALNALLRDQPHALADPRIRQVLAECFAKGVRLLPPPVGRGRPKRLERLRPRGGDPRTTRLWDDMCMLAEYGNALKLLHGQTLRRRGGKFSQREDF